MFIGITDTAILLFYHTFAECETFFVEGGGHGFSAMA